MRGIQGLVSIDEPVTWGYDSERLVGGKIHAETKLAEKYGVERTKKEHLRAPKRYLFAAREGDNNPSFNYIKRRVAIYADHGEVQVRP